jgi:hypothetical protein
MDEVGTLHTVSSPDPRLVLGEVAFEFIQGLSGRSRRRLAKALASAEDALFSRLQHLDIEPMNPSYVGALPQEPVLGTVTSVRDLLDQLATVDPLWQLDALAAIEESMGDT